MDDLIEDEEELDEKTAESTMKPEQKAVLNQVKLIREGKSPLDSLLTGMRF